MPTIPSAADAKQTNVNETTGYPEGYLESLNKSYVATLNLDKEVKSRNQQNNDTLVYGIPRIALGAFTEIAAALPGISDEEADTMAKSFTPDSVFKDFLENKEGSQLAGALATSLIPIVGMTKLMKSKKVFNAVQKLGGSKATNLLLPSRVSQMDRVAKFREEVSVMASKQQIAFTSEATPILDKMRKNLAWNEVFDTLKIGLATDAGIYAMLNESNFFFPEELSAMETAAFYGVPNVVVGGFAGVMMRYQLKNVLRDAGGIANKFRNQADLPLKDILATPGNRSSFVSVLSAQKNIKETEFAKATGDEVLSKNLNSQVQELKVNVFNQVKLMADDSVIPQVTKKWELDAASANTIEASLKKDFSAMHEAVSLESYSARNSKEILEAITKRKESIGKEATATFIGLAKLTPKSKEHVAQLKQFEDLINQKEALELLTPIKINTDGSMQLLANSKPTYDDILTGRTLQNSNQAKIQSTLNRSNEGDIVKTIDKATDNTFYSVKVVEPSGTKFLSVDNRMKMLLPEGVKYESLSFKGKTALQSSARAAVADFKLGDDILNPLRPSTEMHHVELDAMLEVADKFGRDNPSLVSAFKFEGKGIKNFDELEYAAIQSKYKDFVKQMDTLGKQKIGIVKLDEFDKFKVEDLIRSLNLPNDGVTGMHPVAKLFMDGYVTRTENILHAYPDLATFKQAVLKSVGETSDLNKFIKPEDLHLRGSVYKTYEEPRNPIVMFLKSRYENPLHREDLISNVMQERVDFLNKLKLAKDNNAPLISELTESAMRDVDRWQAARQVDTLVEGSQLRTDRFVTTTSAVDNQPTILAVDAIRNEQDNIWRSYAAAKFEPHNATFNKLLDHNNTGDLTSFNIFVNQQGLGWRGKPQLIPVEQEGKIVGYKIALEDHQLNRSLYKEAYGEAPIPDELFMPQPLLKKGQAYKPLVISPLAADSVRAFNEISQDILQHVNYLRTTSGRPPIPSKALHMPAKNMVGKELVYLIDKNTGKLSTIKAGNTPIQVKRLADEEIAIAKKQGRDLFVATETEIENFNMVKLDAFTQMTDFSSPFSQTGTATGKSFGQTIELGSEVVNRMQEALINQYNTISKVSSAMIFQPEFKAAEMTARTAGLQKTTLNKGRTVWDTWMNRALGKKSGNKQQSIGKFYGATEDIYDELLQKVWDKKLEFFKGGQTAKQAQGNFAALDKAVPDFNPFKDSVEFLENTMKIKAPHSMIKHASALNNVTGLAMLRMFEVGLGLINIGTLPTLIPPVAKALQRKAGQSVADWKKANAAWSSVIDDDVAIWNPTRAFTSGIHFMFGDEWKRVAPMAAKKGHLWQKTVEQLQLFSAPAMSATEKSAKKWIDLSAKFVDSTEELSRGISYATFFNMGKKNLKLGDDAAMDFAHHMANRVIGDFRPNVRPQVFQGATGMPFSLFTTFAWNYMQRVFGYVEKGQMKAFMNQMGLQSAFFGAKSLPGFNQYVENFTDNYDGTENLVDRLQNGFGTAATDWLMHGTVGSLTGLATYTRTDIVLPGSNYNSGDSVLDFAAATSMVKQTYKGVSDSIKSIAANEGLNARQLSEIASRSFPIRAMRGWFDIANGMQVDSRGQVLDSNTRNALDVFSRLSSIKTIRNQAVTEEFARQRSSQMRQNDIRQQSRMALRSAFRGGTLDGDFVNTLAERHYKAGGEPAGFVPMLRSEMLSGLVDKAYLRALEIADRDSKQKDYRRLLEIISTDAE